MDLRRLEIFAKVAELGSFSRAAEALYLTQPTVSEHIRTLEDELGVRLLDRLGRDAAGCAAPLVRSADGRALAGGAPGPGELPGPHERRAPDRRQYDSR